MHEAALAALAAANGAHAPYSRSPAGVALVTATGDGLRPRVHAGGTAESAAFNPSISPLQAALVSALADGATQGDGHMLPWSRVLRRCVLVQPQHGMVSHVDTVAGLLRAVAPACQLTLLYAEDCRSPQGAAADEAAVEHAGNGNGNGNGHPHMQPMHTR
jgi:cytidine deaminase